LSRDMLDLPSLALLSCVRCRKRSMTEEPFFVDIS
jgi:hypothetical protein